MATRMQFPIPLHPLLLTTCALMAGMPGLTWCDRICIWNAQSGLYHCFECSVGLSSNILPSALGTWLDANPELLWWLIYLWAPWQSHCQSCRWRNISCCVRVGRHSENRELLWYQLCRKDNLQGHQWWQSWHHDNSYVSEYDVGNLAPPMWFVLQHSYSLPYIDLWWCNIVQCVISAARVSVIGFRA